MNYEITTLANAKSQGQKRYFTGKPCVNGHFSEKYTSNGSCCQCVSDRAAENYLLNKEKVIARSISWRKNNLEKAKRISAKSRKKNKRKVAADRAKRRAALIQRTPAWSDLINIEKFYKNCPEGMTVDHYYPLQGEFCSGLHVIENLRYVTPSENSAKGNKMPEDFYS